MSRNVSLDTEQLAAEGQARALRHAKDAVDRSAWLLAMLREELVEGRAVRGLRRLELHCALADLEHQQAGLSAAYDKLAAMPSLRRTSALNAFILAYDEFLVSLGMARMESRDDGVFFPVDTQSANGVRCSLQAVDGN